MSFLDNLPVASITFLAGLVLTIIAYVSNDISFEVAAQSIGFVGVGSGAIGYVRNQAGRGLKQG